MQGVVLTSPVAISTMIDRPISLTFTWVGDDATQFTLKTTLFSGNVSTVLSWDNDQQRPHSRQELCSRACNHSLVYTHGETYPRNSDEDRTP